jgi:hypothetical protein
MKGGDNQRLSGRRARDEERVAWPSNGAAGRHPLGVGLELAGVLLAVKNQALVLDADLLFAGSQQIARRIRHVDDRT